jgi:hypothetical protein
MGHGTLRNDASKPSIWVSTVSKSITKNKVSCVAYAESRAGDSGIDIDDREHVYVFPANLIFLEHTAQIYIVLREHCVLLSVVREVYHIPIWNTDAWAGVGILCATNDRFLEISSGFSPDGIFNQF